MQAHEVPTHVQAEDRVLGWLTFPQVVGLIAVGALAYGLHRYAPIPWPEVRIGLAVVLALVGTAAVVGRIGGRRLPLVAADLLQYRLGGRGYAGTPAELIRSQPPAPSNDNPGLIQQMTEKTRHRLRRLRRKPGKGRERRNGRRPLRWLRNRRKPRDRGNGNGGHAAMRRTALLAAAALLTLTAVAASGTPAPTPTPAPTVEPEPGPGTPYPQTSPERWRNEIDFDPPEPVPGRRLYVESLAVFEDKATVTLRAATDVDLSVQAFGGPEGRELRFWGAASVRAGQSVFYTLPLSGDAPSFTFAWVDGSGQAGAVSLKGDQLPHPLPVVEGELCDVRVTQVRWSPGSLTGMLQAGECLSNIEHPIDLVLVQGEEHIAGPMVMKTRVTDVYGSATLSSGDASATVHLDPPGSAAFRLPVRAGEGLHELSVEATLEANLRANAPPLVTLTLIPEREETRLVPVEVWRPGTSKTVRETVTVQNKDGTSSSHEVSARLTVPGEFITVVPSVLIKHPEFILGTVNPRGSAYGSREETVTLALTIGADAPYRPFTPPPQPTPTPPPVQTPLTDAEADWLFGILGWEWPW
ncbi:MAG: hypothetical protein OXE02_10645 [Chloroflexi bacterium]|nr:hypothetical protein [Chloroflexota bacterium]